MVMIINVLKLTLDYMLDCLNPAVVVTLFLDDPF